MSDATRQRYLSLGLCGECGACPPLPNKQKCLKCSRKATAATLKGKRKRDRLWLRAWEQLEMALSGKPQADAILPKLRDSGRFRLSVNQVRLITDLCNALSR